MKTVRINTGHGSYDLTVGSGLIRSLGKLLRSVDAAKDSLNALVVCDRNIASLYIDSAVMSLKLAGFNVTQFVVKPGDSSRRLSTIAELCSTAAAAGMRSGDIFIGLGGIICCDIACLAASLYLGGSHYIAVPTTLLGQLSRSIDGQVNADLPEGRRIIGTHYSPTAVFCDTDTLATQPRHSINNGIAEVIMLGCVASDKLIGEIPDLKSDPEKFITRAITLRTKIASKYERSFNDVSLLQFGDLMCRAIEVVSDFSLYHGEALSIGMVITCAAGERAGITQTGTTEKLEVILRSNGLPTTTNIPSDRLLKAVAEDRYAPMGKVTFPLIKSIGNGILHVVNTVDLKGFFVETLPDWVKENANLEE